MILLIAAVVTAVALGALFPLDGRRPAPAPEPAATSGIMPNNYGFLVRTHDKYRRITAYISANPYPSIQPELREACTATVTAYNAVARDARNMMFLDRNLPRELGMELCQ